MPLLFFSACLVTETEATDPISEDLNQPQLTLLDEDSSAYQTVISDPGQSSYPPCSHRTDQREGNGRVSLTMEVDQEGIYTLRPVAALMPEDTESIPNTQLVGYNPETGAQVFLGEKGLVYSCDSGVWVYTGDLDVVTLMDVSRPHGGIYQISQRHYNEDGTLRETRLVDFSIRLTSLVIHQ